MSSTQYVLQPLPYGLDGLEPVISAEIMGVHYGKHHQTYVTNLNNVSAQYNEAFAKGDMDKMNALQPNLKFNYGGHVNHQFYWENLTPVANFVAPSGELLNQINADFGSLDAFITKFNTIAVGVQGR